MGEAPKPKVAPYTADTHGDVRGRSVSQGWGGPGCAGTPRNDLGSPAGMRYAVPRPVAEWLAAGDRDTHPSASPCAWQRPEPSALCRTSRGLAASAGVSPGDHRCVGPWGDPGPGIGASSLTYPCLWGWGLLRLFPEASPPAGPLGWGRSVSEQAVWAAGMPVPASWTLRWDKHGGAILPTSGSERRP